jgi:hypothetical protein
MTPLPLTVALALAGAGVYAAYRNPNLGAALLVGIAILTALYVVWEHPRSSRRTHRAHPRGTGTPTGRADPPVGP